MKKIRANTAVFVFDLILKENGPAKPVPKTFPISSSRSLKPHAVYGFPDSLEDNPDFLKFWRRSAMPAAAASAKKETSLL